MDLKSDVLIAFGNKIRVRACGLCIQNGRILLIKHNNIGKRGFLWAPPGGGHQFGESVEECLLREFKEEVGLTIKIKEFLFVYEFLEPPLHTVELFFKVEVTGGKLIKGIDPEFSLEKQIIEEVRFCEQEFIDSNPPDTFHSAVVLAGKISEMEKLRGYYYSN